MTDDRTTESNEEPAARREWDSPRDDVPEERQTHEPLVGDPPEPEGDTEAPPDDEDEDPESEGGAA